MIHNGIELQTMTHNGVEVQSWIHNGVAIWTSFEPFYWIKAGVVQTGFPSNYNKIEEWGTTAWTVNWSITDLTMCGYDANPHFLGETDWVDTRGAKFLDISSGDVSVNEHAWCKIVGEKNGATSAIVIFENKQWIQKSNIPIGNFDRIKIYTKFEHWGTNWAYFQLRQIYFHN